MSHNYAELTLFVLFCHVTHITSVTNFKNILFQAQFPIRASFIWRAAEHDAVRDWRAVPQVRRAEGQRGPEAQVGGGSQPRAQGDRGGVQLRTSNTAGRDPADVFPHQECRGS